MTKPSSDLPDLAPDAIGHPEPDRVADPSHAEIAEELNGALRQRDWAQAVRLVGIHWPVLLEEPGDVLDEALHTIPINAIMRDPRAAAVRDIRMHSSADAVDRVLGAVAMPDAGDVAALETLARSERALSLLSVASSRMIALRVRGRMVGAIRLAGLVERLGRIAVVHQPALITARLPAALLHSGITRGLADDLPGAVLALRDAYERGPQARAGYVERDAAGKLALFLALHGEIDQARRWLDRHDAAPAAHGWYRPRIALTAETARSLIGTESLNRQDAESALRLLEQPVNVEQGWGPAVTYAVARHALAWGDRLGAVATVRRDRERYADWLGEGTTLGPLLAQAESDLLLSIGQTHQAGRALDNHDEHAIGRVGRARVALISGAHHAAARIAAEAVAEDHSARARADALSTLVVANLRLSGAASARESYDHLTSAIEARDLRFIGLSVPAEDRRALGGDPATGDHGAREPHVIDSDAVRLTAQQRLVLSGLDRGRNLREIAAEAHLSLNTVKTHARALYRRLGATSRDEAIARAYEAGLL